MTLIQLDTGLGFLHTIQTINIDLDKIPDGYAVVNNENLLENFPCGTFDVETINGYPTLVNWVAKDFPDFPEPDPADIPPTESELLSYIADLEEENCLYKLGLTEEDLAS